MEDGNIWIKSQEKLQIDTFYLKFTRSLSNDLNSMFILFMLFTSTRDNFATIGFYVYDFNEHFPICSQFLVLL